MQMRGQESRTGAAAPWSRRRVLTVLGAVALGACGAPSEVEDRSCGPRTTTQRAERERVDYVEASARPGERCDNCMLWQPGEPDACGGCQAVQGPIAPAGWCRLWASAG
jgi:hypothetical protein